MFAPLFAAAGLVTVASVGNTLHAEEKSATDAPAAPATLGEPTKLRKKRRGVRNPGFYDERHAEFKKISDISCFNGGKFDFTYSIDKADKACAGHFKTAMDGTIPGFMSLDTGATFKTNGGKQEISAAVDQNMMPKGKYVNKLNKRTVFKSTFASGKQSITAEVLRKDPDSCHSAKLTTTPAYTGLELTHMKSLTPILSAGAELKHVVGTTTRVAGCVRFKRMFKGPQGEKSHHGHTGTLDVSSEGIAGASYTVKMDPNMSFGADLKYSLVPGRLPGKASSSATASVRYDYDSFMMVGRVQPATGLVSAFLETRINPLVSTLFSAEMNHFNNKNKFGVGVQINL